MYFGLSSGSNLTTTISGNSCVSLEYGIDFEVADTSTVVATISGNDFNSKYGNYFDLSGSGTFSGDITNNTFQIMDDDDVITLSLSVAKVQVFLI